MESRNLLPDRIFIFGMVILLVSISGCLSGDTSNEDVVVYFTLSLDRIETRSPDNSTTVWDAYIMIDDVDPIDQDHSWRSITVQIWEADQSDYLRGAYTPEKYEIGIDMGDRFNIWYDDMSGPSNSADIMDMIIVSGMPEEYEGTLVRIFYNGGGAGGVMLDDDFP